VAVNVRGARRMGTQGRSLPGVAVRIAGDGEILLQTDTACSGRWGEDAGALTDRHGWLRTGDQGDLDSDGFLHVHGRREEQLVLRGRRRTPALVIELRLRAMPLVERAAAFANARAPVALLSLDRGRASRWAREHALPDEPAQLCQHPSLLAELEKELTEAQDEAPETERVRRFAVVPDGFSLEEGERTPTGTVCRTVIARRRTELLEALLQRART
jgi:long-chain acyl-CoA synthetase